MNSNHENGDNNTPLEDDLGKIRQAYRRMEQQEPPDLLDQAILNSAHRAVEKQPHWTQFGWLHGITTAAVVVLAISIILQQSQPVPVYEDDVISNEPMQLQLEKASKKESGNAVMDLSEEIKLKTGSSDGSLDKDAELAAEEVMFEAADSLSDTPQAGTVTRQASPMASQAGAAAELASPAVIAEPAKSDFRARLAPESEAEAEQELLAIIKLKQSGDESWRKELELFLERYPDYPLPDELKD